MSECSVAAENAEKGSSISLKGTSNGFEILIESAASVERIALDIEAKLQEAPGFFKGGNVILRFDGVPPRGYLACIEEITERYELLIVGVHGPDKKSATEASAEDMMNELGLVEPVMATGSEPMSPDLAALALDARAKAEVVEAQMAESAIRAAEIVPAETVPAAEKEGALASKMIVGPVRSGSTLEVTGHLVVLGDVNPGAEVRAEGSIVVLGRLRGVAHAGSGGASAFILALQLEPQQLRVGSLVARAGDSETAPEKAEIAYAKDGSIIVDYYKGRVPMGIATAKF